MPSVKEVCHLSAGSLYAYMGKLISAVYTTLHVHQKRDCMILRNSPECSVYEELKSIFYFTVFLKQGQISGRHYTELLNGISRACGASFAEIIHFAPCFPKNQS